MSAIRRTSEHLPGSGLLLLMTAYCTYTLQWPSSSLKEWMNASSMVWSLPKCQTLLPRRHRLRSTYIELELNEQFLFVLDTAAYIGVELSSGGVGDWETMKRLKKTKQMIERLRLAKHISWRITPQVTKAVYQTLVVLLMDHALAITPLDKHL